MIPISRNQYDGEEHPKQGKTSLKNTMKKVEGMLGGGGKEAIVVEKEPQKYLSRGHATYYGSP